MRCAFTYFIFLSGISFLTLAQEGKKIKVTRAPEKIHGQLLPGYGTFLPGSFSAIDQRWKRFLKKEIGKIRKEDQVLTLAEPTLNKVFNDTIALYALSSFLENKTYIWLGVDRVSGESSLSSREAMELEKIVYGFSYLWNRSQAQKKIDDAAKTLALIEKNTRRISNQENRLAKKLERNEYEKVQLENKLIQNAQDHQTLLNEIAKNRKMQDSLYQDQLRVEALIPILYERLRKVE